MESDKFKIDWLIVVTHKKLVVLAGQLEMGCALSEGLQLCKGFLEACLFQSLLIAGDLLEGVVKVKHLRLLVVRLGCSKWSLGLDRGDRCQGSE